MQRLVAHYYAVKIKLRETLNPYFAPIRRKRLGDNSYPFTIISNNCWGGHVYRYFGLPYDSPTVGLYMFSDEYIKFIKNLKHYIDEPLSFISVDESRYREELLRRGGKNSTCPIGVIDDIEIVFLHYKTREEALEKWTRRKDRIHWNNLYVKMSEQNLCVEEHIKAFDTLQYPHKFVFVHRDYGIGSQIIFRDFMKEKEVINDTNNFRKYINLCKWIKGGKITR